jgi:hypothetical protein
MEIKGGCTRQVILINKYAIKIPRLNYGWSLFLKGLLCNMQEVYLNSINDARMCPILFSLPGGFLSVMPKCSELSDHQFETMDIKDFWSSDFRVPVEHKIDSFGLLNNNIVAVDYGS